MGIEPTYPSEKYGYIKPMQEGERWSWGFTEKPTKEKAEEYIAAGALWNGGVFAYKLSYVLGKSRELLGTDDYETLFKGYADLKKISFDYAVVEVEKSIEVLRYSGTWKDLGTWNTLTKAMEENTVGDARLNETCENVHVINELGVPILVMGLKDAVVSASPEGILVSDKEQSSYIKDAVNAAFMICEMFAFYKTRGISLLQKLEEIYSTYGYCLNTLHSYEFPGSSGMTKMQSIMADFHRGLSEIAGKKVTRTEDYSVGQNGLPESDVLKFFTDSGSVVIRPSGTEPKLKAYISVMAADRKAAEKVEAAIKADLEKKL